MAHIINKVNGITLYNTDNSLLTFPEWKEPGWPGDPNYHVNIDNLVNLYLSGVLAIDVKAVDIGGGVFQAQVKTPYYSIAEKSRALSALHQSHSIELSRAPSS
jgi:hypothetical protein